jgi:hypothetical protein
MVITHSSSKFATPRDGALADNRKADVILASSTQEICSSCRDHFAMTPTLNESRRSISISSAGSFMKISASNEVMALQPMRSRLANLMAYVRSWAGRADRVNGMLDIASMGARSSGRIDQFCFERASIRRWTLASRKHSLIGARGLS